MARWWIPVVALVVSVAACQQREGEQVGTTEETPAVDAATVEQTIRSEAERYEQAVLSGDVETLVTFYSDDAILLPAGMTRSEGTDAIRSAYQQMYSMGNPTAFSIEPQTIVVSESGDIAYEVGTYTWTGPAPDGTTITDTGKYVAIWEPTGTGEWKIVVDTWNSDQMPGAPAPEGGETPAETAAPAGQ